VTSSSLTSVGTLTSLTVTGDVNIDSNTLYVDSSNSRVGIGKVPGAYALDVNGSIKTSNYMYSSSYMHSNGGMRVYSGTSSGGEYFSLINTASTGQNKTLTTQYLTMNASGEYVTPYTNITYSSLDTNWNDSKFDFNIKDKPILTILGGTNNYVGINDTSPAYPLDVSGTVNISTGQTYKINGTDVLSGSSLGTGVTSSSLTSVGTLTGLNINGSVQMNTNGFVFDSTTNRVGIRNDAPTYTLDVCGNMNVDNGSYKINGTNVLYASTLGSSITSSSLTSVGTLTGLTVTGDVNIVSNTLKVDSANNRVGINNASPIYPLDVSGTVNISTGQTYKINGLNVLTSSSLGTGVTSSSLTSVGTLTSLTVTGDINIASGSRYQINGTNILSAVGLGSSVVNSSLTSVGTLTGLTVAGDVNIDSNTLKVDGTNNRVGIVNAAPAYTLDVSGDIRTTSGLNINTYSSIVNPTGSLFQIKVKNGSNVLRNRLSIDLSGNTFIGADLDASLGAMISCNVMANQIQNYVDIRYASMVISGLDKSLWIRSNSEAAGNPHMRYFHAGNNAYMQWGGTSGSLFYLRFSLTTIGNWNSATGAYTATSDVTLKENIQDLTDDDVDLLDKLKPKYYKMKHHDINCIGLIAQDVLEVNDEKLNTTVSILDQDAKTFGLTYTSFIPLLIGGYKKTKREAQIMNDELKALRQENQTIKTELDALKQDNLALKQENQEIKDKLNLIMQTLNLI
jgi:hypothetical protein